MNGKAVAVALGAALAILAAEGVAHPTMAQMGPPPGGPPPEAFTACEGKETGAACSHPIPNGTMQGSCQTRGSRLQCIPERGGGPGGGGNPQLDASGNETGNPRSPRYTFDTVPVPVHRSAPRPFALPGGATHWYEAVHTPEGGINWVQAKALAELAGGHLATLQSEEENDFVFGLIADAKFWFQWDSSHNYVMNGPFLGGFQPAGSSEPSGGWRWVTGEPWTYENWAVDGMPGDNDPRPNTQPNDATGNQNVMAFGEVNRPVSTWGDFPHRFSSYQSGHDGKAMGFVIEYERAPK